MVQKQGKKRAIITASAILLVLLAIIGTVAIIRAVNPSKTDPYKQSDVSEQVDTSSDAGETDSSTNSETSSNADATENEDASAENSVDPATVSTIDIQPMSITVSYVKGIGGFEYAVNRTASGTQYVAFSSPELVGTKCTDDTGEFATILADPGADESATLTKSTTVEGTKYGLSLTASNCTSDPELLKQYQSSFNDAFSLLKKM